MLIDTHSHLHVKEFDADRAQVISRARSAGVDFIAVGFEPEGNEAAARIAEEYKTFWTAGIHPHHANLATDENLERIVQFKKEPLGWRLAALGEMGLDYFKNFQSRELQHAAFRKQLALSHELKLPVIIHCRDQAEPQRGYFINAPEGRNHAFADTFKLLEEEKIARAVFHCFTGGLTEAEECLRRGYLHSFTGICTYPKAETLRRVIAEAPLDRIMIETDCPFLPPQSHRGKRNEPAFLRETFKKIAEIKQIPEPDLEQILYNNTINFFHIQHF